MLGKVQVDTARSQAGMERIEGASCKRCHKPVPSLSACISHGSRSVYARRPPRRRSRLFATFWHGVEVSAFCNASFELVATSAAVRVTAHYALQRLPQYRGEIATHTGRSDAVYGGVMKGLFEILLGRLCVVLLGRSCWGQGTCAASPIQRGLHR